MNATAVTYIHARVKGCGSCPYGDYEYDMCRHPCVTEDFDFLAERIYAAPPDNCPLRKTAVIIRLETT